MENKSFYVSPMAKVLIVGTLLVAVIQHRYIGEKFSQAKTFIAEKTNTVKDPDGFNETSFSTREAEVAYIREYVQYKLIKSGEKKTDNSRGLINKDENGYGNALDKIFIAPKVDEVMSEVVRLDLSISQVKDKFKEIEKFQQGKLNERVNSSSVKQPATKNHVEKENVKKYLNANGELKTLDEIVDSSDYSSYYTESAMVLGGSYKEGKFHIVLEIGSPTSDELGVVNSWIYFVKNRDSKKYLIKKIQGVVELDVPEGVTEVMNALVKDSKNLIAAEMGLNGDEVEFTEIKGNSY